MSFFTKRSFSLLALVVGVTLFAGAVFADLVIGSGYQQLKDSVRTTSRHLSDLPNYSFTVGIEVALDGQPWMLGQMGYSRDLENGLVYEFHQSRSYEADLMIENDCNFFFSNYNTLERLNWYASDRSSVKDQVYSLTKNAFSPGENGYFGDNPLDDPMSYDLEKVLDALVGSLSSLVQVSTRGEGKEFTGTLNETQVPLLVQAITSYLAKDASGAYGGYVYSSAEESLPFTQGATISAVNGRAFSDAAGRLIEVAFDFTVSGTDTDGKARQLTAKLEWSLDQIGQMLLAWPDLSDKQVEERSGYWEQKANPEQAMQNREAGLYKADIVLDTGERYVKIGERFLELNIDSAQVQGCYWEVYFEGYEEYAADSVGSIEFAVTNFRTEREVTSQSSVFGISRTVTSVMNDYDGHFTAIDSQGREREGYLDLWGSAASMYLDINPLENEKSIDNIFKMTLQRAFE